MGRTKLLIVTPEQLVEGWFLLKKGEGVVRRAFTIVKKLDDGNYLVHDPNRGDRKQCSRDSSKKG